jgi:hypothetical protein
MKEKNKQRRKGDKEEKNKRKRNPFNGSTC